MIEEVQMYREIHAERRQLVNVTIDLSTSTR